MNILTYLENFLKCQLLLGFVILCMYLVYRRKYIEGFLGFSDYSIDYNKKIVDLDVQQSVLKKKCSNYETGPGFDCLRVGFYCGK